MKNLKECIEEIVSEEIGTNVQEDMNLFENGLDSLGTLRILTFIEDSLNVEIPDDELEVENFETINRLIDMVSKYVENC